MSFADTCTIAASLLHFISAVLYIRDILGSRIRPSIATFGILSVVSLSQLIALIDKDVWNVVPFTAVGLLQSLVVFFIALRGRRFYFELTDKIALVGAALGFAAWLITHDAAYNIYIINLVTVMAFIPLIVKSFREPQFETRLPWSINLASSVFLLAAITSPSAYAWVVPVRHFVCVVLINIGLALPRGRTRRRAA